MDKLYFKCNPGYEVSFGYSELRCGIRGVGPVDEYNFHASYVQQWVDDDGRPGVPIACEISQTIGCPPINSFLTNGWAYDAQPMVNKALYTEAKLN